MDAVWCTAIKPQETCDGMTVCAAVQPICRGEAVSLTSEADAGVLRLCPPLAAGVHVAAQLGGIVRFADLTRGGQRQEVSVPAALARC